MKIEEEINYLKQEIEKIKLRNKKVEKDKAWETSLTRTLFVAISTYILVFIFMYLINDPYPYYKAFIGAASYFISTLTYRVLKNWWLKKKEKAV